jgi:uncharacterized repeat protein (TIGR01451 family)
MNGAAIPRAALGLGCTALLLLAYARPAAADPALRVQMDLHGDFVLFGNTVAHECSTATPRIPMPLVGMIGDCPDDNSYAPDVYWRSDSPSAGEALADSQFDAGDARSTAVLVLPSGAEVAYARLYWGALSDAGGPDTAVRLQRPSSALDAEITADDSVRVDDAMTSRFWYQSTADVTALVKAQGAGAYRVAGIDAVDIVGLNDTHPVMAWYMIVLYARDGEPPRNLAIFDGLDLVDQAIGSAAATLSGFLVPDSGFDAKLGVVAYEGEAQLSGDSLEFNGSTLSNAVNPANNFFNATRSRLGSALSVEGDLPQLSGAPRSLTNVDIDVVDVKPLVAGGDTSATIEATSNLDTYLLAAFVTSISTFKPDFVESEKTVTDLNGGALRRGDVLEYEIAVRNTGSDTSVDTVVTDALPAGLTYVTGSLEIASGANAGALTDAAGDDQGEYTNGSRTVTVRLGDGADDDGGGELAIGAASVVRFRVKVDADASGTVENQAVVTAGGAQGAAAEDTPTDGNGGAPGQPPTAVTIDLCESDADCTRQKPYCDFTSSPRECVECLTSAQCTDDDAPDCNTGSHVCECAGGAGKCKDKDGDGISDGAEKALGTDPNDADSDDDGVPDGSEIAPDKDSDGDGLINALDPDSDDDGLFDGTELGFGCDGDGVDLARGQCRPDADGGDTRTNPIARDTDGGGARDGSEDFDLDGEVDKGETDPTTGHGSDDGKVKDKDKDGLGDELERTLHSDPNDADTDDDGARDGEEANPSADGDGDGLIDVLDVDSDDDGLFDGTELGYACDRAGTKSVDGHCNPDNDGGATTTSPLLRDTDGGGASDGAEDANLNGIVDGSEQDPTRGHAGDDGEVKDSDGDGLSDALEKTLGTKPKDKDSDDDGVLDGAEPNPSDDADGDGRTNARDADSDGDGSFDGTELGFGCDDDATDTGKDQCVADGDGGRTRTSPLNADTDFGGRPDGTEDADHDGGVDRGETDPNDARDDKVGEHCDDDGDCGADDSGVICFDHICVLGCRGESGNGCPEPLACSSTSDAAGECVADVGDDGGVDAGMTPRADAGQRDAGERADGGDGGAPHGDAGERADLGTGVLGGGGCNCRIAQGAAEEHRERGEWLFLALGLAALRLWKRSRRG